AGQQPRDLGVGGGHPLGDVAGGPHHQVVAGQLGVQRGDAFAGRGDRLLGGGGQLGQDEGHGDLLDRYEWERPTGAALRGGEDQSSSSPARRSTGSAAR